METLLITGGAGFIGSHFVDTMYARHPDLRIIVLDALTYAGNIENISAEVRASNRFSFWHGDINNVDLVSDLVSQSKWVVHFAAETHVARSLYSNRSFFETDVLGTQAVAHAVLKNAETVERFVHISTSEVYGTALERPMTEDHPLEPTSPYASAKAGADRLVSSYVITYDLPAVIVRPFNNYGPRQHLEKVIPRFITSCLLDEPLTIHGDGSAARDWVYVQDTVDGLEKILLADRDVVEGRVFNIATETAVSVLELAEQIDSQLGNARNFVHTPDRNAQVDLHIGGGARLFEALGWRPSVSFEEGLAATIAWFRENEAHWAAQIPLRRVPVKMTDGQIQWY